MSAGLFSHVSFLFAAEIALRCLIQLLNYGIALIMAHSLWIMVNQKLNFYSQITFFCFLSLPDPLKYWGTFFQASFFCSCGLECHRTCSLCLQHRGRAITAHLKKLAWVFTVTEFHGMLTGKAVTAGKLAVICGWPLLCWEVKCMHPWACSVKVDGLPQLWASLGRSQCDRRR